VFTLRSRLVLFNVICDISPTDALSP